MKTSKRRRKLLLQTTLIIIPVFLLMAVAVAFGVYTGSVNSFLDETRGRGHSLRPGDGVTVSFFTIIVKSVKNVKKTHLG